LAAVSEDVGIAGELVAASEDVGGVSGIGGKSSDDGRYIPSLVVEVIGVLGLDEGLRDTGKGFGSGEGSRDDGTTVVVKLALVVLGGEFLSGELS
jgi:hypothetical protein